MIKEISITNRDFWDHLPKEIKAEVIKEGEEVSSLSWSDIPLSLYEEFSHTGDREHFQSVYFEKRKRLGTLILAEACENKGTFIRSIKDGIWSLISEPAWVIPAHNSYIRDTPQLPLPLLEKPILDLFACETGEILSLALAIIKPSIEKELSEDIKYVLRERIIKPYLNSDFWWMGTLGGKLNNWSVWCTQNVLLALLSANVSEEDKARVIRKAEKTISLWLDEYGDDGCCDEGASYYHAAGLCLWGCLYILSGFNDNFKIEDEKIKNIASYIEKVHVADDIYLNFADCSPKAGALGAREYMFAKATGNEEMMNHAAIDFKKSGIHESDNNYNLFYRLLALKCSSEILSYETHKPKTKESFVDFRSVGITIYRDKDITLAVKSGCNDDSHNHNDTGSITLYKGSKPLLIDIGVETYTKTTFSPDRYTLLPMQSFYHNVVNFPPYGQVAGSEYKATDVKAERSGIRMELSLAYDKKANVKRYIRELTSPEDGIIFIHDAVIAGEKPTLTLMTVEKPIIEGNRFIFPSFTITFDGMSKAVCEEFPVTDARLRLAWPSMLYRNLISFDNILNWRIDIKNEN